MSNRTLAASALGLLIALTAGSALAQGAPTEPAPPAAAAPTATTAMPPPPPPLPTTAAPAPVSPVPVPVAEQPSRRPPPPPPAPPGWGTPPPKDEGPETLFGGRSVVLGGFGGVTPMYTRLVHTNAMIVCGEGALLINHEFSVGAGGCGAVSKVDLSDRTGVADDRLNMGYGGLKLRYHFLSRKVVNVAIGATVGGGGLQISKWDHDMEAEEGYRSRASFFVFEPEAAVYVNFTRWARAGLVGGYRVVAGVEDSKYLSNSELSGVNAGATLQFGWF